MALVTGATAGTGRAIAHQLGADVDPKAGQETAREIEERGGRARSVRADIASGDDARVMVSFSEKEFGGG